MATGTYAKATPCGAIRTRRGYLTKPLEGAAALISHRPSLVDRQWALRQQQDEILRERVDDVLYILVQIVTIDDQLTIFRDADGIRGRAQALDHGDRADVNRVRSGRIGNSLFRPSGWVTVSVRSDSRSVLAGTSHRRNTPKSYCMKVTSQMRSPTWVTPTLWPAKIGRGENQICGAFY
jgi:hypothetical protein